MITCNVKNDWGHNYNGVLEALTLMLTQFVSEIFNPFDSDSVSEPDWKLQYF